MVPLMVRRLLAPAAGCLALLFGSCGLLPEPAVRLLTDRPELAAYAERFNVEQAEFRLEVGWRESPAQAVLDGEAADLVIGDSLASADVMDRLDSLADIVKPGRIDPAWFYPGLLAMGSRDNRPLLVPLSFDLPAVAFARRASSGNPPPMLLPLATMRTMAASFTSQGKGGGLASVGFPPLWSHEFQLLTVRLFDARLRTTRGGSLAWDPEALDRAVTFLRSWIGDDNGGVASERAFVRRNLEEQPWDRLLGLGRILFAVVPLTEFASLPEEKRRELDFRWLSSENLVPVLDDALFAGVPRAARNKRGARAFLEWFVDPATQRSLLEANRANRLGVFGVTDGLSALKALNEKDLPTQHPILLGHVPPESALAFPDPLPDLWPGLRQEVILPWLAAAAASETAETLDQAVAAWQQEGKRTGGPAGEK